MCLNKAQLRQTVRNTSDWLECLVSLYLFSICHQIYPSTVSVFVAYLCMAKSWNNCFNNAFVHVMKRCPGVLKRLWVPLILSWLYYLLTTSSYHTFLGLQAWKHLLVLTWTVAFRCNINVTEWRMVLFITVTWQYLPICMAFICSFLFQTCCFI